MLAAGADEVDHILNPESNDRPDGRDHGKGNVTGGHGRGGLRFFVGEFHAAEETVDLCGVGPVGRVMLGIRHADAVVEHRLDLRIRFVFRRDLAAQVNVVDAEDDISVELLIGITGALDDKILVDLGVDQAELIGNGVDLFLADVAIAEHLIGDVFAFDFIEIVKRDAGETRADQILSDRTADRAAPDDVDAAAAGLGLKIIIRLDEVH